VVVGVGVVGADVSLCDGVVSGGVVGVSLCVCVGVGVGVEVGVSAGGVGGGGVVRAIVPAVMPSPACGAATAPVGLAGKASAATTTDTPTVRETCRRVFLAMMLPDAFRVMLRVHRVLCPFAGCATRRDEDGAPGSHNREPS
jgi:hypothetical protein